MAGLFSDRRLRKKKGDREGEQASKRAAGVLGRVRFVVCGSKPPSPVLLGSAWWLVVLPGKGVGNICLQGEERLKWAKTETSRAIRE